MPVKGRRVEYEGGYRSRWDAAVVMESGIDRKVLHCRNKYVNSNGFLVVWRSRGGLRGVVLYLHLFTYGCGRTREDRYRGLGWAEHY